MSSESRSVIEKLTLRILTSIRWRLLQPKPPGIALHSPEILTLGSKYGRKSFIRPKSISETLVVISGGVGEDISFDVELANLYKCKIILVDPSSHAIGHIQEILKSLGQKAEQNYSDSSRQPISSYDLSIISKDDLQFRPLGLWSSTTKLDFYQPPDASRDASGSIGAIHSYYKPIGIPEQINVITIKDLIHGSHGVLKQIIIVLKICIKYLSKRLRISGGNYTKNRKLHLIFLRKTMIILNFSAEILRRF
jgi:hypothetical protein